MNYNGIVLISRIIIYIGQDFVYHDNNVSYVISALIMEYWLLLESKRIGIFSLADPKGMHVCFKVVYSLALNPKVLQT